MKSIKEKLSDQAVEKVYKQAIKAIVENDLKSLEYIIGKNKDQIPSREKELIIHEAARNHNTFDTLFKAGFDPNHYLKHTKTKNVSLLFDFVCKGDYKAVEILIRHGANVNSFNVEDHKKTPLMAACDKGSVDIVETLLNSGANPNHFCRYIYNHNGAEKAVLKNALMSALTKKEVRIKCIELLLDHGADPYAKSDTGLNFIGYANIKGDQEVIDFINSRHQQEALSKTIGADLDQVNHLHF